jgi:hypothetical protein
LLVGTTNNSGVVGGIDSGTWSFWQNNVQSFATMGLTAGAATMQTAMNRAWLNQARQADTPDLFIADNNYYRFYWESLQAIQRISSERDGEAGYTSLKFMNADVVYDGGFQGNTAGNVSVLGTGGSWLSGSGAPTNGMFVLNGSDTIH